MKSKPVQNSVKQLVASGIQPDFLIARAEEPIDDRRKATLAWTTNIPADHIIAAPNVDSIYRVPVNFDNQGLTDKILQSFGMPSKKRDMKQWNTLVKNITTVRTQENAIEVAVVGKYFETGSYQLADVYVSVIEALKHASWANKVKVNLTWIPSVQIEKHGAAKILKDFNAICVPGGFGSRGVDGIIEAVKYARVNKLPYLGLCYGMQLATIEFARNVAKLRSAHTTEVEKNARHPLIHIMPEQEKLLLKREYGATMRLGAWDCIIKAETKTAKAYAKAGWITDRKLKISERHRHRYEFNNAYREKLEAAGLVISGTTPDGGLVEIIELKDHPFFVASQFHPEFKSRPFNPHPLFMEFVRTAKRLQK